VPFQADTPAAVLLSHLNMTMPPTRELSGELSLHVEETLRQALAKAPNERFPTASEFVAALTPAAWPRSGAYAPADDERPQRIADRSLPKVLVVDDRAANRELIEACLAGIDCEVRVAEDGPSALKAIETA